MMLRSQTSLAMEDYAEESDVGLTDRKSVSMADVDIGIVSIPYQIRKRASTIPTNTMSPTSPTPISREMVATRPRTRSSADLLRSRLAVAKQRVSRKQLQFG